MSNINSGSVDWLYFSYLVMNTIDKDKYPDLVNAITSEDWMQVATIAMPLVIQGNEDIVMCYSLACH